MEEVKKFNTEYTEKNLRCRFSRNFSVHSVIYVLCFFIIFSFLPTLAAQPTKPSTYSPEYCNFNVTFPGEPYTIQRCDEEDKNKCYDLVSYTQTYDMASTVNFRVICSKVDESLYSTYSTEIMAATLKAMTDHNIIKTYDLTYREDKEDGYKQAGLVGEGKSGQLSTIYIAQLWIGSHSALSVEAELIGDAHPAADKLFSDVLKSVGFKEPEAAAADGKKEESKPAATETKPPAP